MRPHQFAKNGIVFIAFVFSVRLSWQPAHLTTWLPLLVRAASAFVAFCAVSSAEYLINDVRDVDEDRLHPRKRFRPVAAGEVAPATARITASALFVVGAVLGAALGWGFELVLGAYALAMLAYTYVLKHLIVADVLTIAAGFVLRAVAGALAIHVPVSPWLYLCTVLGALFFALDKRRHERLLLRSKAGLHRLVLSRYSPRFLDMASIFVAVLAVLAYGAYATAARNLPKHHVMLITVPFVVFGIIRYLRLAHRANEERSAEDLILHDRPLLACGALWFITAGALLAAFR